MRRLVWLLAILSLVLLAATPAGARSVVNESNSGYEVAAWFEGDGYVSATEDASGGMGFGAHFYVDYGCPDTPGPTDLAWVQVDGDGELAVFTVDPLKGKDRFMSGFAFGHFGPDSFLMFQYCLDPEPTEIYLEGETFEISMTGEGPVWKATNRNTGKTPGSSNDHQSWRGEYRSAYGYVDIGVLDCAEPCTTWAEGGIGKWSYSSHSNSK